MKFERFQPASSPKSLPFRHPTAESSPLCFRNIGALRSSSVATVGLDTASIKLTFLTDPKNGNGIPEIGLISGEEEMSLIMGWWLGWGRGMKWAEYEVDVVMNGNDENRVGK